MEEVEEVTTSVMLVVSIEIKILDKISTTITILIHQLCHFHSIGHNWTQSAGNIQKRRMFR